MKKLLFSVLICFSPLINGQEIVIDRSNPEEETLVADHETFKMSDVEIKPEFPGGLTAFDKFILDNFVAPNGQEVNGKMQISFIIQEDGSLSDLKLMRDLGYGTGKELMRVLKKAPKWKPGKNKGKNVRVIFSHAIMIQKNISGK